MLEQLKSTDMVMVKPIEKAEADEMDRFVQSKKQERWLWHANTAWSEASDQETGQVLDYVLADHQDNFA